MYRESEIVELKTSIGEWREVIVTLVAFANKKGGKVVVGIDDHGEPTGMQIGKGAIEDLANKIKNHTDPVLYPSVMRIQETFKSEYSTTGWRSGAPAFFRKR